MTFSIEVKEKWTEKNMWDVILFDHSHISYKTLKPDTVHGKINSAM